MYNDHFRFRESPFTTSPNSRLFYNNSLYREALANLRYGIEWRKGLILMTGEVGTGKTTLLWKTMRGLEATVRPVLVSYDHLTSVELLRITSHELGLNYDPSDRLASIRQLRDHLLTRHAKGETVALLIDEAQNLSDDLFEDIRFLSNIETESEKLLQIVLTGQPELEARLNQVHLRHVRQRVVIHCRLAALKKDEVGRYIAARLREAGYEGESLFPDHAVGKIAAYSEGIPRLINIICDNALLVAYAQSQTVVRSEMIEEVANDLGLGKRLSAMAASPRVEVDGKATASRTLIAPARATDRETQPTGGHKRKALLPAGVLLALVAIGSAAGSLSSWPIKGYLLDASLPDHDPSGAGNAPQQVPTSVPMNTAASNARPKAEARDSDAVKIRPGAAKPIANRFTKSQVTGRPKERELGDFQISGANSFLRAAPRSDGKITATLPPGTPVRVVSVTGNYYGVQVTVHRQKIRGYVHREDAFFQRVNAP